MCELTHSFNIMHLNFQAYHHDRNIVRKCKQDNSKHPSLSLFHHTLDYQVTSFQQDFSSLHDDSRCSFELSCLFRAGQFYDFIMDSWSSSSLYPWNKYCSRQSQMNPDSYYINHTSEKTHSRISQISMVQQLLQRNASSSRSCCLLKRAGKQTHPMHPMHTMFLRGVHIHTKFLMLVIIMHVFLCTKKEIEGW